MPRLNALLLLLGLSASTAAATETCIQQPKRQQACPHLLYRVAQLPGMAAPKLICICVTDFAPLLQPAANETEQIKQNMTQRQLEAHHGEALQTVLAILKRQL